MKKFLEDHPKVLVAWEVFKDFARWALSFFVGWIIDNGYAYIAKSKLDPQVILVLGVVFKYADSYWHKYRKEVQTSAQAKVTEGKSLGFIPF